MAELINWDDIVVKGSESGSKKTSCPKCSPERKKKNDPCLYVNFDSGVAKCFHCMALSFRDSDKHEITEKQYIQPPQQWQNYTKLSDNMVKWISVS